MKSNPLTKIPDYLVLGHVSKDLLPTPPGYAPGGTVTYSSLTAQRLGLQAAMVTAYASEDDHMLDIVRDAGVWIHRVESPNTTTFRNIYDAKGHRTQLIISQASPISLNDIPEKWRSAPIIHLGPVAQELPIGIASSFASRLLGITPQGWMRSWDRTGRVTHTAWPVPSALLHLPANALLVLSIEDLGYDLSLLESYAELAPLVVVTQGSNDALVYNKGIQTTVPPFHASPTDLTGAGDVFATVLFISYSENRDPIKSARFAHAAAACKIEDTQSFPDRHTIKERFCSGV